MLERWGITYDGTWLPFVMPWSGEAVPVQDPAGQEVKPGEVIRGQFGKGTPVQLIPNQGVPLQFPELSSGPQWSDVWNWVTDRWNGLVGNVAQTIDAPIEQYVAQGLASLLEALSGYVNLAVDYTSTVAEELQFNIDQVGQAVLHDEIAVNSAFDAFRQSIYQTLASTQQSIVAEAQRLEGLISQEVVTGVGIAEQWAMQHIFLPLEENLGQLRADLPGMIDTRVMTGIGIAEAFAQGLVRPLLNEITNLQTRVAKLEAEDRTCVQPMCETMGPGTNLGNALKALEGLFGLLAGIGVGTLTLAELETIAESFESITQGTATTFTEEFVHGGASFATAGAGILSDLDGIAAGALHTLHVPGF